MPSFSSLLNSLLRVYPSEQAEALFRAMQKLHPSGESLSDGRQAAEDFLRLVEGRRTLHAWQMHQDWYWPYWVRLQTSAESPASADPSTGLVLENRAARSARPVEGAPGRFAGLIDPRGMVTPACSLYSVECWMLLDGKLYVPASVTGRSGIVITTHGVQLPIATGQFHIDARAVEVDGEIFLRLTARYDAPQTGTPDGLPAGMIYFAVRPYNMERVTLLHDLVYNSKGFLMSDNRVIGWMPRRPDQVWVSNAANGDAGHFVAHPPERTAMRCGAGLATAMLGFEVPAGGGAAEIFLPAQPQVAKSFPFLSLARAARPPATESIQHTPVLVLGDGTDGVSELYNRSLSHLYALAEPSAPFVRQLLEDDPSAVHAITQTFLTQGEHAIAGRFLQQQFLGIQKNGTLSGAIGFWAAPGQLLQAIAQYYRCTARPAEESQFPYQKVRRLARWIFRKRRELSHAPQKPKGLLPPGRGADRAGLDYHFTDNFWALQGLCAAQWLARHYGEHRDAEIIRAEIDKYTRQINAAIHHALEYSQNHVLPINGYRQHAGSSSVRLLELALMPEAFALLKPHEWMTRLLDFLTAPLTPGSASMELRRVDETGVRPGDRALLAHATLLLSYKSRYTLAADLQSLTTESGTWCDTLNQKTREGTAPGLIGLAATAGYLNFITARYVQEDESRLILLGPGGTENEPTQITLHGLVSRHGHITATLSRSHKCTELRLQHATDDPAVGVYWQYAPNEPPMLLGNGAAACGNYRKIIAPADQ